MRSVRQFVLISLVATVLGGTPASACTGDCDENGAVAINELVRAVSIALGQALLATCDAIDENRNGEVGISELIAAVNALLGGCTPEPTATVGLTETPNSATPTSTLTATATATLTPTPTATVNRPPVIPTASVYRTFPGFPIRIALGAFDPDGGGVDCAVDSLPASAAFDAPAAELTWTPGNEQLGPFYVPYACTDRAPQPAASQGLLTFRVSPLDPCSIPTCDPATGCTTALKPLDEPCCTAAELARVAEPVAGCPEGLVAHVGQNVTGFGRLQNCDVLMVRNFEQSGAEIAFNVETRCLRTLTRIGLQARMDSNAANHPLIFNIQSPAYLFSPEADGFARRRGYRFPVSGGPFFDIEGAEANLTITLTETSGNLASVTEQVRVRLTFTPRPDLPDVDPSPAATPTVTPSE